MTQRALHPQLVRSSWRHRRLEFQKPPKEPWRVWVFLGGRGAGKTRTMAEWVRAGVETGGMGRVALVGPSYEHVQEVMIEGPSGLRAIARTQTRPHYLASRHILQWSNGAMAQAFSAEDPDALRGPQFHAAWGDEFCAWRKPQRTLDTLVMGVRLGAAPKLALSTTPRPIPALKRLLQQDGVEKTHGRTADALFLPQGFRDAMQEMYAGGRLGAQELDGEVVEDRAGALWNYDLIERARGTAPGTLERIVVAVDPPVSSGARADACGVVVAGATGEGLNRRAFVLGDATCQGLSPDGWARAVVRAYEAWRADRVIAEANQGGDLVARVLRGAAPGMPVRLVRATRGKTVRAEPAAALYERGQVTHCGVFPELEAEMRALGAPGGESDDRVDALVWALTDLMLDEAARPRVRLV